MKNTLQFDHLFDAELLVNEADATNSIWIWITTDENDNQQLEITLNGETAVVSLTSDALNKVQLTNTYWNYGGSISLKLTNDDLESESVMIVFPESITTDSVLFPSAARQYSLQGQYNVEQAIDNVRNDMQGQINDVNGRLLEIIPPTAVDRTAIYDGGHNEILTFKFNCTQASPPVLFYSMIAYTVQTTVSLQDVYGDCTVTIYYILDDATVATIQQTYGDGKQVLMLNYQMQNLTEDNHVFKVRLDVSGGNIV